MRILTRGCLVIAFLLVVALGVVVSAAREILEALVP